MAIVAGASIIVMVMMANVCLFLIRAGQFDRICSEVARRCAYSDSTYSAQQGIEEAMGFSGSSWFSLQGQSSESGGICATRTVTFEMQYRPLFGPIRIGSLAIDTPTLQRTKTFSVPVIGSPSSSP